MVTKVAKLTGIKHTSARQLSLVIVYWLFENEAIGGEEEGVN
jgi:hypothetical protein